MNQIVKCKFIALGIAIAFMACNSPEKKAEPDTTNNDTTEMKTAGSDNTTQDQSLDASKVASALYKVAKDSMGIRVLDILYKPGDSSVLHSHPDAVFYVIDGGKAAFISKEGTSQVVDLRSGMMRIPPATTHSVKNVGKTTVKAILVEVNRPGKAATMQDTAMDAMKVAPTLYKKIGDTMNIRVLIATYKPGASSPMHTHPDYVIYAFEGGKAEFTEKDGKKMQNTLKKGDVSIIPAGAHSVKNIGNTTIKVLIAEINRPVN